MDRGERPVIKKLIHPFFDKMINMYFIDKKYRDFSLVFECSLPTNW
jgi:hypothetical protein